MAVNNNPDNKLYNANDTSIKFFASLTRQQAKGNATFIFDGAERNIKQDYPGAICFVSDAEGNSIFLNGLLFGDGAISGGGSGGGGITEVTLDIIPVIKVNGTVLKTLADYFNANGTFITEGIEITKTLQDGTVQTALSINSDGITIGNDTVVTQTYVTTYVGEQLSGINTLINSAKEEAKSYADTLVTSVYKVKGSKETYSDLVNVTNQQVGDVWNVKAEVKGNDGKIIPEGTNFVWTGTVWDPLGGTFNVNNFYTKSEVVSLIETSEQSLNNTITQNVTNLQGQITANGTAISNISQIQAQNTAKITEHETKINTNTENITQNTTNITNISTQLTWQ